MTTKLAPVKTVSKRRLPDKRLLEFIRAAISGGELNKIFDDKLHAKYMVNGKGSTKKVKRWRSAKKKHGDISDVKLTIKKDSLFYARGGKTVKVAEIPPGLGVEGLKAFRNKALKAIAESIAGR